MFWVWCFFAGKLFVVWSVWSGGAGLSKYIHLQNLKKIDVKRGCFRAYFQTLKLKGEGFIWQKGKPSKKPL